MKKVNIIKNNEVVQFVNFEDEVQMNEWINMLATNHPWGKPAYDEVIYEEGSLDVILETISHEAEYTVEIVDITNEVNQKQINQEAEEYLRSTDWYVIRMMDVGTPMPEGMPLLRQQARDRIIK